MRRKKIPLSKILNGQVGRNKFENRILSDLTSASVSFGYETSKIPYTISGNYLPDFIVQTSSGLVYLETKGYFRPEAKRKMVAVKKCNPELDIRLVFYSKNKTNIRWAEKNKFPYCFYTIPEEWLNEFRS